MTAEGHANTIREMPPWPRITLSLPPELIKALDDLAERRGLSRGSYVRMLLTDHIRDQEAGDGDN